MKKKVVKKSALKIKNIKRKSDTQLEALAHMTAQELVHTLNKKLEDLHHEDAFVISLKVSRILAFSVLASLAESPQALGGLLATFTFTLHKAIFNKLGFSGFSNY